MRKSSPYHASAGCIIGMCGKRRLEARTRIPQAASRDIDGRILETRHDNEPRPKTVLDWLVWLALWPTVTVAWLVSVPFVRGYVAVAFLTEVIFGIRLRDSNDSD
jgi:hypothetical protein